MKLNEIIESLDDNVLKDEEIIKVKKLLNSTNTKNDEGI